MTQLMSCDGRELTVRPVGEVSMRFAVRPGGPPIKYAGPAVVEDEDAREVVRALIRSGWYDGGKVG